MVVAIGEGARARLHDTFAALCRIASPTGHERACADWIARELTEMGLEVVEDGAGEVVGADAGNLLVRIPGRTPEFVLLCAHMDTVPLTAPLEPVLREGVWENAGAGILGADNKAAVAVLIELARLLTQPGGESEVGVELLFTISEETGLHGAGAFDVAQLRSRCGFVFDHASPIGEVIVAAPTYMRVVGRIRGRAAHAGLAPERGRNAIVAAARAIIAMPQGRLDAETTTNVGVISGGTATNVVAERCTIEAEVRGIEQARVDAVVTEVVDALQEAVDASACDLDLDLQRMFTGYRVRSSERTVEVASHALRAIGYEPRLVISGGGSDVNALRLKGFDAVNVANGTEHPHEPIERVDATVLETGLELVAAIVAQAGMREAVGAA